MFWGIFHNVTEINEDRPASGGRAGLDVASAIAYHKTAREIDVEFVGGGQNHPGRRFAAIAMILPGMETSHDCIDWQSGSETPVHLLNDIAFNPAGPDIWLVCHHDEPEPRNVQPIKTIASLWIQAVFIQ